MAKKVAKKESAKKIAPKAAKKPEKKVEKKPVKKAEVKKPAKVEKKPVKKPLPAKKTAPVKPIKKEEKKPQKAHKVEPKKKIEVKETKKAEKKAPPAPVKKAEPVKAKIKLPEKKEEKKKEIKKEEKVKAVVVPEVLEDKKGKKTKAAPVEVEEAKKPGRPAKEAAPENDLVGGDDGDWEEEEIIDIEDIDGEKRSAIIDEELKDNLVGEILTKADGDVLRDILTKIREPKYFSVGADECLVRNCDSPATTANYCRLHYIKNWNDIKKKQQILVDGKLQDWIELLVSKYPVKYIEAILQDLSDEKAFHSVLKDLNIESVDESFDDDVDDNEDDSDIAFETKATFKSALGEED